MASHFGITSFFFSVWSLSLTIQDTSVLQDIYTSDCRIAGVTMVSYKNRGDFDFLHGQTVCMQLGLRIARKSEIEKARMNGFETCSFGWVEEGLVVISRISPNLKCGQNKTGVVPWRVSQIRKFYVYCYNSSDTWINSCIPEESTTALLDTSTDINVTSTAWSQDTSAAIETTHSKQIKKSKVRIVCVTEIMSTPETTMEEETLNPAQKHTAFKHDGVLFGGVPIVLLVLALTFFVATVVLAVCYVKKYKKTFPFSNKEEKNVEIETKNISETKISGKIPEQEPTINGAKAEEPQAKPEPPVKCLEAEV
uniref:Lymphatic vessel endothelial hyaluronan receptor 1 n=1 Tax=Salvator merianae TaxID=96440 RepID=A0A8D0C9Q0_SALMN